MTRGEVFGAILQDVLGEEVPWDSSFFDAGGDSLAALRFATRLREAGWMLELHDIWTAPSLRHLAATMTYGEPSAPPRGGFADKMATVPLAPAQIAWLRRYDRPANRLIPLLFEIDKRFDPETVRAAVNIVFARHDALRLRIACDAGEWTQRVLPQTDAPFTLTDLSSIPTGRCDEAITAECERVKRLLSIEDGPAFRAAFFRLQHPPNRLFLVFHHGAVDGFSLEVLVRDIIGLLEGSRRPEDVGSSFSDWTRDFAAIADGYDDWDGLRDWLETRSRDPRPRIEPDCDGGPLTYDSFQSLELHLSVSDTQAVLAKHGDFHAALLSATADALRIRSATAAVELDVNVNGRDIPEGAEPTATVGLYSLNCPMLVLPEAIVPIPATAYAAALVRPNRVPHDVATTLAGSGWPALYLNFVGRRTSSVVSDNTVLRLAREPVGLRAAESDLERHPLSLSAHVLDGELRITWWYSDRRFRHATAEEFMERFLRQLL